MAGPHGVTIVRSLSNGFDWRWLFIAVVVPCAGGCEPSFLDIAARGDLDALKVMAEARSEFIHERNNMGKTPLHYAVTNGRPHVIAWLIEEGADADAQDMTGMTPLHVAATLNRHKVAAFLIEARADLTVRDDFGDTPLHTAAMHGRMDVLRVFVEHGASLKVRNNEGFTAAGLARRYRKHDAVEYLEQWVE